MVVVALGCDDDQLAIACGCAGNGLGTEPGRHHQCKSQVAAAHAVPCRIFAVELAKPELLGRQQAVFELLADIEAVLAVVHPGILVHDAHGQGTGMRFRVPHRGEVDEGIHGRDQGDDGRSQQQPGVLCEVARLHARQKCYLQ